MGENEVIGVLRHLVAGQAIQESDNLKNRLKQLNETVRQEMADAYYADGKLDDEEVFEKGLELGRLAEDDAVYRIELDRDIYYFIGDEADIARKLDKGIEVSDELEELKEEDVEIKALLARSSKVSNSFAESGQPGACGLSPHARSFRAR
jgi:hypothetical protein